MAVIWRADASAPMGDEWARLNAGDQSGGNPIDPSSYTGNRASQVAPPVSLPAFPKVYRAFMNNDEAATWTASFGARTELGQHNGGSPPPGVSRLQTQGQLRYIAYQVLISSAFSASSWCALQQNKVDGAGNGALSLHFESNKLRVTKSQSQTYGSTNIADVWVDTRASTPRDTWLKILIEVLWSTGSDGYYAIYGDIADGAGYKTLKAKTTGWTLKFNSSGGAATIGSCIGVYRAATTNTGSVYFAGFNVSDTKASAETAAAITAAAPTAPAPTAAFTWSPTSPNTGQLVTFDASTSTAGTGTTISSYAWDLDGTGSMTGVGPTFTFQFTGIKHVTLTVQQTDGQTATVSHDITVGADVTAPDTTITSPANGATVATTTPTISFTSTEAGSTFQARVDGGAYAPVTSPWVTPTLSNGSHTIDVRATDAAGNVDATPASITITVAGSGTGPFPSTTLYPSTSLFPGGATTTAPNTTISAPAAGATVTSSRPTVTFTADQPSTFEGRVDGGAYAPQASPWQLPALANGSHTVDVRAINTGGVVDPTPASVTFTVSVATDTTAPNTTILTPADEAVITDSRLVFTYTADEPSTFEYAVNGGAWVSVGAAAVAELAGLSNGVYVLQVRATDLAGNVDATPASVSFTVAVPATTTGERLTLGDLPLIPSTSFWVEDVDLTPPAQRLNWVRAADSEHSALVDPRVQYEDRTITLGLRLQGETTKDAALFLIGEVQDRLVAGGTLDWTPAGSTQKTTFRILAGRITGLALVEDGSDVRWMNNQMRFNVELTCEPYGRGQEYATSPVVSSQPVASLDVLGVPGDAPPDARLIVTDTANRLRRHLVFGVESNQYRPGAPSPVMIDASSLTTSGFAGTAASIAGAFGTGANAVTVQSLRQPLAMCGIPRQTHEGTFRVFARAIAFADTTQARLSWKAGDGPLRSNDWAQPSGTGFRRLDLGTITVPASATGSGWAGQIEIRDSSSTRSQFVIDYLALVPCGDAFGVARGVFTDPPSTTVNAFDDFTATTAGGVLNGRANAASGYSWTTTGAATDFTFADYQDGEVIARGTLVDTSPRLALISATSYTNALAAVDILADGSELGSNDNVMQGVVLRYVDANNYLRVYWNQTLRSNTSRNLGTSLILEEVVGGTVNRLDSSGISDARQWFTVRAFAYDTGRVVGKLMNAAGGEIARVEANSATAATGGTLASGRSGVFDMSGAGNGVTRYYDNAAAGVPPAENVAVYANRSIQIDREDAVRWDNTGTTTGTPSSFASATGFRLLPGDNRVVVMLARNDVTVSHDAFVTDSLQLQVAVTPRFLVVPRS